jgi:hypothetical protein
MQLIINHFFLIFITETRFSNSTIGSCSAAFASLFLREFF